MYFDEIVRLVKTNTQYKIFADDSYLYLLYKNFIVKKKISKYDRIDYPYFSKNYIDNVFKTSIKGLYEPLKLLLAKDMLYKTSVYLHYNTLLIDLGHLVIRKKVNINIDYYVDINPLLLNLIIENNLETIKYSINDYLTFIINDIELINRISFYNYEIDKYFDVFNTNNYNKKVLIKNTSLNPTIKIGDKYLITNGITEYLGKEFTAYTNHVKVCVRNNNLDYIFLLS